MNIEVVVSQVLFVEQEAESNIKGLTLEDRLAFTQAANQNLNSRQLSSFILVNHLAVVGKSIQLAVEQELVFTQEAFPRAYVLEIAQHLFVWHEAIAEGMSPLVVHNLDLEQTVEVEVAKAAYDTLTITQTVDLSLTRNLTIEQTFVPAIGATGYLPSKYWHSFEIEVVEP